MRFDFRIVVALLLFVKLVNGGDFAGDYSKLSGIIIPGFASMQLRAWSILDCPYTPLVNPLDLVWLDTTKLGAFYSQTQTMMIAKILGKRG